jgi:hypothetical protein
MLSPTRFGAALIAALMMTGSAEAASVGVCGGGGGSQSKTLSCPSGQYIVGLSVRAGYFIDRIGVRCASIASTGKRGTLGAFQFAGGTGGSESDSATCRANGAVIGLDIRAGSYIDKVFAGRCRSRQAQGGFVGNPHSIVFRDIGGFRGNECVLICSGGEAIHRIIVRYGSWLDSIEAFCRP